MGPRHPPTTYPFTVVREQLGSLSPFHQGSAASSCQNSTLVATIRGGV